MIHARYTSALRVGFITLLLTSLAVVTKLTGALAVFYFLVLWVVPLFSSFAFFMILRQLVQHGNGGRGWINNTRTFLVAPFIRFAVFPLGQDYHLPHHMYATVPHYRLKRLHALLMAYLEYRAESRWKFTVTSSRRRSRRCIPRSLRYSVRSTRREPARFTSTRKPFPLWSSTTRKGWRRKWSCRRASNRRELDLCRDRGTMPALPAETQACPHTHSFIFAFSSGGSFTSSNFRTSLGW